MMLRVPLSWCCLHGRVDSPLDRGNSSDQFAISVTRISIEILSVTRVHNIPPEASHGTMGNYISKLTWPLLRDGLPAVASAAAKLTMLGKWSAHAVPQAVRAEPSPPWPGRENTAPVELSIKEQAKRLNFGGDRFSERAAEARKRMYLNRRHVHGSRYVPGSTQFELDHEYEAEQHKRLRQNLDAYYTQRRFLLKPEYDGENIWKMGWPVLTDPYTPQEYRKRYPDFPCEEFDPQYTPHPWEINECDDLHESPDGGGPFMGNDADSSCDMLDGSGADVDNNDDSGDDMPQDDGSMEEREAFRSVAREDSYAECIGSSSLDDDKSQERDSDSEASWKLEDDTASHYSGDSQGVYVGRGNKGDGTTFSWRIWASKFGDLVSDETESTQDRDAQDAIKGWPLLVLINHYSTTACCYVVVCPSQLESIKTDWVDN
jgi:hypothetical protein